MGKRALPLAPDTPMRRPMRLHYAAELAGGISVPELMATARREADEFASRIAANAKRAFGRTSGNYPVMACAFLAQDGACSVYEQRPFVCRRMHSFDADMCRRGVEGEPVGAPTFAPVMQAHSEVALAFEEAVVAIHGGDTGRYELHRALEILLRDPNGDLSPALVDEDPNAFEDLIALNPHMFPEES
jgi:hypothetical protein